MNAMMKKLTWQTIPESWETQEQWLERRKDGIGASEVAAIFGCGYANQSPVTVWAAKTGGPIPEITPEQQRRFDRGHRMEPVIAQEFEVETGLECYDPGDYAMFWHVDHAWLFSTLDRYTVHPEYGPIPVELKAVHGRFAKDWDTEEEPPLKFQVQCQTQMACTGTSHCYLVGFIGGDEVVVRLIERNQRFIDAMILKLKEFWGFVERKEMPPVDESEATRAMLGLIYRKDDGGEVTLPDEFNDLDRQLLEIKDEIKKLETRKDGIENRIKAEIGNATRGVLLSGSYSWKSQTRESVDAKRLANEFPSAYQECLRVSEFMVLRRSNK